MTSKLTPTVIGIDIGAAAAKLAAVQRGTIDVITNEANFRQTPVVVGYGQGQRKIGEMGHAKLKSNFKNTVLHPNRFLGLNTDSQSIAQELSYSPSSYKIQGGKLLLKVNANDKQQTFTPEQVLASFMTQLGEIINHNNLDDKLIMFSVPSFFTQIEKKALINAAHISGIKNANIVSDAVSVGLDYGSFKKSEMGQGKYVAFIDFGHSKLSINLIKFTGTTMEIILHKYNRNLGCRDIDRKIFDYMARKFQQSKGLDLRENKKACLKLLQAIQRQRKILSGISQTDISIQCLMQDQDLSEAFTRDIMFNQATQVFNNISELLNQFKEQVSKLNIKIDSVELVGGGSRIPKFIQIVEKSLQMNSSRTINSSQTIARGATLAAVQQSGLFRFHSFKIFNRLMNKIYLNWQQIDSSIKNQDQQIVVQANQILPFQKTVKVQTLKKTQINLFYELAEKHIQNKLGTIEIEAPIENKNQINIKFIVEENGYLVVSSVKDNDGNPIKFNYMQNSVLTSEQMVTFKAKEKEMFLRDFKIVRSYQKKNELQSFIYKHRQLLNNQEIKKFAKTEQKQNFEKLINEISNKLQSEQNNMQLKDFQNSKIQIEKQFKMLSESCKKAKAQIMLHIKDLEDLKNKASETVKQINQRYRNTKFVSQICDQIKQIENWSQQALKLTKTKPINQLPVVSKKDISQQHENIKILIYQLVNPEKSQYQSQPQPQPQQHRQKPQQQYQQQRRMPQQHSFDPFGMNRSGYFGNNGFFGNMGGFF